MVISFFLSCFLVFSRVSLAMETLSKPPAKLKDSSVYETEVESLVQKTKQAKIPLEMELHKYADALYLDLFSDSMRYEDWRSRINSLTIHHFQVMGYPPDDSLFLAAQLKALEHGDVQAVKELYTNNLMAISGKYKDPEINKLERKFDSTSLKRTLVNAKALMSRWENDQDGLELAVEEFLGVPTGLDECITFAAKQLLLREKTIHSTIEKASQQKFKNNDPQGIVWIKFIIALTKKRFLVSAAMRELIRIKGMKDRNEKRLALGLFAGMFVRARFTNKLPDDLLVHLQDYEPLSPKWFYFHMQLDKCMMASSQVPCYSDLGGQIQAQVFFENVLFARIILACRGEAAEPYRKFLHLLAFDQSKSAVLMATWANKSCLDAKTDVYQRLYTQQKLTPKTTGLFFSQNLQRSIESCANESGYATCKPLNPIEIELLSSAKKTQSLADDWFMDLSESEPKKEKAKSTRKKVQKKKTTTGASSSIILKLEDDSSPESSVAVTEFEAEAKESKDSVILQQDPEEDLTDADVGDEIEDYLAEHEAEVSEFKAMKSMKKYQFDALRDASRSLGIAESPKQLSIQKISVVFFSTDDFLALHPEAAHVYQLNMYSELANEALTTPKIKLQWVFSKDVVIGQDTFIFLCQVFHLVEGRSKLTFDDFLKAVDDLTKPTIGKHAGKKSNRTVFRFNHAFVINGEICLPPIGGVHREHASSRFNYKQVKKFLMHGGAHPYFFQVLEEKPTTK